MHKKIISMFLMAGIMTVLGAASALAESKHWHEVGTYQADGKDAIEVDVDRPSVTIVRIECTEGSVIINTIVARSGSGKDAHTVGKRLEKGDAETIDIGESNVTGFRISHDGRGKYKVSVK